MTIKKLYAPDVTRYIRILHRSNLVPNRETNHLIDLLFDDLKKVAPFDENGKRVLWLSIDRGPIEAFGNYEEAIEEGDVFDYVEFEKWWLEEFPDKKSWYYLEAIENDGYRVLALNHNVIFHQIPNEYDEFYNFFNLIQCLKDAVSICNTEIEKGTYNQKVQRELPYCHRTGTIKRKSLWDIFPKEKEAFLKNISEQEISEFLSIMKTDSTDTPSGRIHNMTSEDFFRCCSLGYHANDYEHLEGKSWKEQYLRHADGRTDGLVDIDEKSPDAFSDWYHNRPRGGHPWEVCRGGNSTHISLYISEDEKGYYKRNCIKYKSDAISCSTLFPKGTYGLLYKCPLATSYKNSDKLYFCII